MYIYAVVKIVMRFTLIEEFLVAMCLSRLKYMDYFDLTEIN